MSRDDLVMRAGVVALAVVLLVIVGLPLWSLLAKGFEDRDGRFVGPANFITYFSTPALFDSALNSIYVAVVATAIVVPLAFTYAYALTRAVLPVRWLFQGISLIPIFAPSLLPGIALIYLFGNQGLLKELLGSAIYGFDGIVIAQVFYCIPHATLILATALATADARLYEAAEVLGTRKLRVFLTVTLPGAKYGLISAALVVFTLVITDFGIPKVIGGNFNMLATDVFKLVIGQQDFQRGAVVGLFLLVPAVLTFAIDWLVQRKQTAMLTARAVPLKPRPARGFDALMLGYVGVVSALMLAMLGMAIFASFATYWPYNLAPSWKHYTMGFVDAEVGDAFLNSLKLAAGTAFFGTIVVFVGAYMLEKTRGAELLRPLVRLLAMLRMAVPGLVLGLGYIFFFNAAENPLHGLYQTLAILIVCTVVHFYTTGHLTAVTALKQLDAEFEAVSASLKVPFFKTFWRVTLPICTPTLVDIARYFFVNAMTTISAVVFLYSPETKVAAIAILNLDEAGEAGAAAACAVLITAGSTVVTLLFLLLGAWIERRTQAWRRPAGR